MNAEAAAADSGGGVGGGDGGGASASSPPIAGAGGSATTSSTSPSADAGVVAASSVEAEGAPLLPQAMQQQQQQAASASQRRHQQPPQPEAKSSAPILELARALAEEQTAARKAREARGSGGVTSMTADAGGSSAEDSQAATVANSSVPIGEEVPAPAPVQIAAATQPGAKFTINERVVVLAKNPALAARGRYEAAVLKVGPKTKESGRCRKSKFEYLVRYDGYGSDWDEWLPESSVEGRNDQTLKQVSVPTFEASVKKTPRSKSKDTAALTAADTGENSADGGGKVCELFGLYFGVHGGSLGLFRTCIFSYHYHSISHARNK